MTEQNNILDKIKEHAINLISTAGDKSVNNLTSQQVDTLTNLFIELTVLEAGHVIKAGPLEHQIDRDTYMVFADDQPNCNWSHPCRYILYDASVLDVHTR